MVLKTQNIFITGANWGIGLTFAKHVAEEYAFETEQVDTGSSFCIKD